MTIQELLEEIETVFRKAGVESPSVEAQMLVCHILGVDRLYLFTHKGEYIDEKVLLGTAGLVNERCKGRPMQYILGSTSFCGIDIVVDERVLIPRPETELLVQEAVNGSKEFVNPKILDICTGSGCIAAAIAESIPDAEITASEISLYAIQLANHNTQKYKNIKVVRSDLFEKIDGTFDIIVSNPPYVAEKYKSEMQREVKDFEPHLALFAGEDGMDVINRLLPEAGKHLKSGGLMLMEIGEDQGELVKALALSCGFSDINIEKDLAGLDRYLKARKI